MADPKNRYYPTRGETYYEDTSRSSPSDLSDPRRTNHLDRGGGRHSAYRQQEHSVRSRQTESVLSREESRVSSSRGPGYSRYSSPSRRQIVEHKPREEYPYNRESRAQVSDDDSGNRSPDTRDYLGENTPEARSQRPPPSHSQRGSRQGSWQFKHHEPDSSAVSGSRSLSSSSETATSYTTSSSEGDFALTANCMNSLFTKGGAASNIIRCTPVGPNGEVQVKMTLPLPSQLMKDLEDFVPTKQEIQTAMEHIRVNSEKVAKKCNFDYSNQKFDEQVIDDEFGSRIRPEFYTSLFESRTEATSTMDDEMGVRPVRLGAESAFSRNRRMLMIESNHAALSKHRPNSLPSQIDLRGNDSYISSQESSGLMSFEKTKQVQHMIYAKQGLGGLVQSNIHDAFEDSLQQHQLHPARFGTPAKKAQIPNYDYDELTRDDNPSFDDGKISNLPNRMNGQAHPKIQQRAGDALSMLANRYKKQRQDWIPAKREQLDLVDPEYSVLDSHGKKNGTTKTKSGGGIDALERGSNVNGIPNAVRYSMESSSNSELKTACSDLTIDEEAFHNDEPVVVRPVSLSDQSFSEDAQLRLLSRSPKKVSEYPEKISATKKKPFPESGDYQLSPTQSSDEIMGASRKLPTSNASGGYIGRMGTRQFSGTRDSSRTRESSASFVDRKSEITPLVSPFSIEDVPMDELQFPAKKVPSSHANNYVGQKKTSDYGETHKEHSEHDDISPSRLSKHDVLADEIMCPPKKTPTVKPLPSSSKKGPSGFSESGNGKSENDEVHQSTLSQDDMPLDELMHPPRTTPMVESQATARESSRRAKGYSRLSEKTSGESGEGRFENDQVSGSLSNEDMPMDELMGQAKIHQAIAEKGASSRGSSCASKSVEAALDGDEKGSFVNGAATIATGSQISQLKRANDVQHVVPIDHAPSLDASSLDEPGRLELSWTKQPNAPGSSSGQSESQLEPIHSRSLIANDPLTSSSKSVSISSHDKSGTTVPMENKKTDEILIQPSNVPVNSAKSIDFAARLKSAAAARLESMNDMVIPLRQPSTLVDLEPARAARSSNMAVTKPESQPTGLHLDADKPDEGILRRADQFLPTPPRRFDDYCNDEIVVENDVHFMSEIDARSLAVEINYVGDSRSRLHDSQSTGTEPPFVISHAATTFDASQTVATMETPLRAQPGGTFDTYDRSAWSSISGSQFKKAAHPESDFYNFDERDEDGYDDNDEEYQFDERAAKLSSLLPASSTRKKKRMSVVAPFNVSSFFLNLFAALWILIGMWTKQMFGLQRPKKSKSPEVTKGEPNFRGFHVSGDIQPTTSTKIQGAGHRSIKRTYHREIDAGTVVQYVVPDVHGSGDVDQHGKIWSVSSSHSTSTRSWQRRPRLAETYSSIRQSFSRSDARSVASMKDWSAAPATRRTEFVEE
jgi:hypothetical protein